MSSAGREEVLGCTLGAVGGCGIPVRRRSSNPESAGIGLTSHLEKMARPKPVLSLSEWKEGEHPRDADGRWVTDVLDSWRDDLGAEIEKATQKRGMSIARWYLEKNAEKLQESGWTKGKYPNLITLDGAIYKVEVGARTGEAPTPEDEYRIIPATRADVWPTILKKIDDPAHRLHGFKAGLDAGEQPTAETPAPPVSTSPAPMSASPDTYTSAEGYPFVERRMAPTDIGVLKGMQFKRSEIEDEANQVSSKLKNVQAYDQATAGPLTVWERADGQHYVMNGHHRRELAIRTGVASVPVRVFRESDGITFETARALGALQNVRDGKGTPLDAAFVMKDLGFSPAELQAVGVNLRSGLGRDAVALMSLPGDALQMVKEGVCDQNVAAGIAESGLDPVRLTIALRKAGDGGLETRNQGEILGRRMKDAQLVTKDDGSGNLFGDIVQDVPWAEAATIESAAIKRLARDQRLYRALIGGKAVGGTQVDVEAQQGAAAAEEFARQAVATTKAIQDVIDTQAVAYAANPTKGALTAAVDAVLEVARTEGLKRMGTLTQAGSSLVDDTAPSGAPARFPKAHSAAARADERLNRRGNTVKNPVQKTLTQLLEFGKVEVGWRESAGATDPTMNEYREWAKVVAALRADGAVIDEQRIKHDNGWASIKGGFWNSIVYTLKATQAQLMECVRMKRVLEERARVLAQVYRHEEQLAAHLSEPARIALTEWDETKHLGPSARTLRQCCEGESGAGASPGGDWVPGRLGDPDAPALTVGQVVKHDGGRYRVTAVRGNYVDIENTRYSSTIKPGDAFEAQTLPTLPTHMADLPDLSSLDFQVSGLDLQAIEGHAFTPETPSLERWFFRYGAPPEGGRSRNHVTGDMEAGISVYATPRPTSFIDTDRPLYAVRGVAIGLGSDDEPVIVQTGEARRLLQ